MEAINDRQIAYIYSPKLMDELNKVVQIRGRAELVNSLINSYGLLNRLKIINPLKADEKMVNMFHSQEYVNNLKLLSSVEDEEKFLDESEDDFGIGYDCPFIENMFEFCCTVAGASLTAAHLINMSQFKYVVNWFGGWHHAKREKASGYCYVNDIVLCILKLRQKFNRVLYIDLDLHHGDGVQSAFEFTNKVMTLSFHKWFPGFFPGSGSVDECGKGPGKFYTVNVALQSGVDDLMFTDLFTKIFNKVMEVYRPEVIVAQCGADGLFGDPVAGQDPFNLTTNGYLNCVKLIMDKNVPAIFLGGGGYNFANTSRLWCSIVGLLAKAELNKDIPEHENFLSFGPDYELNTSSGFVKNKNTPIYINNTLQKILENLNNVKCVE